jgi:Fe-S-cluster containining protein
MDEIKRCTGHCCEIFYLPFTPKQLKAVRKLKKKKGMNISIKGNKAINSRSGVMDIRQVAEMAIPISPSKEKITEHIGEKYAYGKYYTCKNFDKETKNCKIYDLRPKMCRDFPYGLHTLEVNVLDNEIDQTRCYYKSCNGCQNKDSANYLSVEEYVNSSTQNSAIDVATPIEDVK